MGRNSGVLIRQIWSLNDRFGAPKRSLRDQIWERGHGRWRERFAFVRRFQTRSSS